MIPVLEARESLLQAQVLAVGTGSMEKRAQERAWKQWQRQAAFAQQVKQPAIDLSKMSEAERAAVVNRMGFKVLK